MLSRPHHTAHALAAFAALLALSACSQQKTSSPVYEKAAEECLSDVIPQQFVVHYTNGEMAVVHAASEEAFIDGFVSENLARIEFAEPDYKVRTPVLRANSVRQAAGLNDNWGVARINAPALWQQNVRGAGITVAVVDSGLDVTHPQMASRVLINSNEIPDNGIDDDQNGLTDDYYGWDYVANKPLTDDYQYHGTHVSGIVAAHHTDSSAGAQNYVQGAAPEAKILPLAFLNKNGDGAMSNSVRAIAYAIQRGARVINASWGGAFCSRSLRDMIATLDAKNVLFVAAAGNEAINIDRFKTYPASLNFPALISVGATGENDIMADFSNYGAESVHIFAPGSQIISTIPNSMMAGLSGTSMAAPFVSGAAALLLSAEPTATNAQLRQALYATSFRQHTYMNASRGRMDLREALAELRRRMGN